MRLTDVYLAWTDASKVTGDDSKNSCANLLSIDNKTPAGFLDISPKCGIEPAIIVRTPLAGSSTFTDVVCNDDNGPSNNGTATAIPSGGEEPYTYLWDDSNAQTTATATGLTAGNYTCTITDKNNCTFDVQVTISDALAFSASATPTDVSCNDDDGNAADGAIAVEVT
ncbi:SprB repeat-containing protein, partial [Christiangramia gaetbulicola]|uniref:SprB repeat-containing protein n=1 Tax=Christiangramia gaetbulicola TaxID=703340 RepID=UPI001B8758D4